jgi:hypothetical protein
MLHAVNGCHSQAKQSKRAEVPPLSSLEPKISQIPVKSGKPRWVIDGFQHQRSGRNVIKPQVMILRWLIDPVTFARSLSHTQKATVTASRYMSCLSGTQHLPYSNKKLTIPSFAAKKDIV